MKVTIDQVIAWDPCEDYDKEKILKLFGKRKTLSTAQVLKLKIPTKDKLWALFHNELISEKTMHLIACDIAEQIALPIWDKRYPDDNRPSEAIRIKRLWMAGKTTDDQLAAARDAARDAAWAAARDAARDAARAAARAAAWDAARAAAWDAAWAAAWAAAGDAAWDAALKIVQDRASET